MKFTVKIPVLLIFLMALGNASFSQKLINLITKTEKAVFSTEGYNDKKSLVDVASGFFISAGGLAITKASMFGFCDSVIVKTRNGKVFNVEQVISVHPYANLALIKVEQRRQKEFEFLQVSRYTLISSKEVLILSHPAETEKGISVEVIIKTGNFPFVNRYGLIISNLGNRSFGAPVVNSKGLLTGIYASYQSDIDNIIYSAHLLNDSLWLNLNIKAGYIRQFSEGQKYLNPYLSRGILNNISEKNTQAARAFTNYLKIVPDSYNAYCLRALSRYRYGNEVGGREDIDYAIKLNPNGFFAYYINGLHFLENNKPQDAYESFTECLYLNPNYIPAKVEHARLEWKINRHIRKAFNEFTEIIDMDSLCGDAYYERARLSLQYSSDKHDLAFEDLNRAIYLSPSLPGVFSLRGMMKLSNKDYLSAIDDFTKALKYDDKDVHAYFNRGKAFFNIGMKKSACNDWEKAGELGNYAAFKYISRYCSKTVFQ